MRHNIYKSQNRESRQRRLQNDTFRRSLVDDGILSLVLTTRGIHNPIADFISKIMNDLMKPAHFALKIGTAHTVLEKKMEQLLAGTFLTNVVLTICELNRDNVQLYSRYRP